jgi:hypothetical protein
MREAIPLSLLIREAEAQARDRSSRDKDASVCTVWQGRRDDRDVVYVRSASEGQPNDEAPLALSQWARGRRVWQREETEERG